MAQWFRMYAEVLDDPKVQRLAPDLFKDWVNLLCLASKHDGELPPVADIAFALRMNEEAAAAAMQKLTAAGLLDETETGASPHNWSGRQFKSDVSNERVRRHRQRRSQRDGNDTHAVTVNGGVTLQETPPEQSRAEAEQSRADEHEPEVTDAPKADPSVPAKPEGCAAPKWDGYAVWELWQERLAANGHATSPHPPTPKEIATGKCWTDGGADRALIAQAFDAVLARRDREPPRSLRYCDGAVKDALNVAREPLTPPASPGRTELASPDTVAKTRLATYHTTGVWFDEWGARPQEGAA